MRVLVINCGSSSIKYRVFDRQHFTVLSAGLLERIGEKDSRLTHEWRNDRGEMETISRSEPIASHREGFARIVAVSQEAAKGRDTAPMYGIGHRVVHGGEVFQQPVLIDNQVIAALRAMTPLAPLHNPANLIGIEVAMEQRPEVPQVAVFDTAFHQSMPPHAFHYALPYDVYTGLHVRRYGFHGTSHQYVARQAAIFMGKPLAALNLISLHLGNGASAAAIQGGKSIDTSMGMTPLEGLIMGTRCGDLDPAIHFYLARQTGKSFEELEALLNRESGLMGICGANDMREILHLAGQGNDRAALAIDMYCYRIKKYIGAYSAVLGHVDALIFTGGIGQNAAGIRQSVCADLNGLGIDIDSRKNETATGDVSEVQSDHSSVRILVIATNEELEIAQQTVTAIRKAKG